jgi:hypothetical protein
MLHKVKESTRKRQEALREERCLHDKFGTSVLLEKCFLLELDPTENKEYCNALERVKAGAPAVQLIRVMETSITLSRMHKQGVPLALPCLRLTTATRGA